MPREKDPYAWKYFPERKHLFCKQLSKHNIGAYREICQALGSSIEVVPLDDPGRGHQGECVLSKEHAHTARLGSTEPLPSDGRVSVSPLIRKHLTLDRHTRASHIR